MTNRKQAQIEVIAKAIRRAREGLLQDEGIEAGPLLLANVAWHALCIHLEATGETWIADAIRNGGDVAKVQLLTGQQITVLTVNESERPDDA